MTALRSAISLAKTPTLLVLASCAIILAGKPANAVLCQLQHVNASVDSPAGIISFGQVGQSVGEQGTLVPAQVEKAVGIGQSPLCPYCSRGASSAEFCDYTWLTSGADIAPMRLSARPTSPKSIAHAPIYGGSQSFVEHNDNYRGQDFSPGTQSCENSSEKKSPAISCGFDQVLRMPDVLSSELFRHREGPLDGNNVNSHGAVYREGDGTDDLSKNISGVPAGNGIGESSAIVGDVVNPGEYDLVVECKNLTLRIVWFGENVADAVSALAVSGHDQFVFRQVEDDDSSVRGADLGDCHVGREQDEKQNMQTFLHVILSSGNSAIAGFTSGPNHLHTCFGCTVLVSDDARHWREITAIREALLDSKRDQLAPPPSQE
jgi:hypothetical protein